MTKTHTFPFPSYKRAFCSVCLPSYVNLFLFFPLWLPLALVLLDHPTLCVCVCNAPCFYFFLWPDYSCLEICIRDLLLQHKAAAQHIRASGGELFK